MNKGVIFWVVWVVVVGGAGAVYFLLVHPQLKANETQLLHRDLLAARLTEVNDKVGEEIERPSATIRSWAEKLAKNDTKNITGNEKKIEECSPESLLSRDVDKKIYSLYPLSNNRSKIPNESHVKAAKLEDEALAAERRAFVDRFKETQFSADLTLAPGDNKDFQPAPPKDSYLFIQWVMGSADRVGQDQKIDQMLEAKLGKGCMKFLESSVEGPGASCTWKEDGRCSGYIEDKKETRELVLRRLLLRRLVFAAVARARAPVKSLVKDTYEPGKKLVSEWDPRRERQVQTVDSLAFVDSGVVVPGTAMAKGKSAVPYRPNGFVLRIKCHPAVVPDVVKEIERIGDVEKRPFACWVERVLIDRPMGKPEWRADALVLKPSDLPRDGGNRYQEWPVSVEIAVVVPEFDLVEKLDPAP